MSESLPPGWVTVRVDALVGFVRGVSFKKDEGRAGATPGHVPVLRAGNLQAGRISWNDLVYVPGHLVSDTQRLRNGDIVVAMSSGSASVVGKAAPVREEDAKRPAGFGAFCGLWRPRESSWSPWVQQYFQSAEYRQTVSAAALGVNINNLRADHIGSLEIPVPPLNEQRRIVAKLESLQARSRRAREALDAVPPLLEKLRQSILAAAFRGDLTKDWRAKNKNVEPAEKLLARIRIERRKKWEEAELAKMKAKGKPPTDDKWKAKYKEPEPVDTTGLPELPEGWCWAASEEVVEPGADIVYGIVQPGPVVPGGVPYIRGTDIQYGTILEGQLLRTSRDIAQKYERAALRGGDVLLGIIRATKVAIVPATLLGANITQGTARFRPGGCITTAYLASWLDTPFAQGWLHAHYRGIDMPGLNLQDVRRLPVALAPHAEQDAVVQSLREQLDRVRAAQASQGRAAELRADIDRAILSKAFRGELVPQDPNDEPAEAMLAQMRNRSGDTTNDAKPKQRERATGAHRSERRTR